MIVRIIGHRPASEALRELFSRTLRGRGPITQVQRQQIPYWQQQGWTIAGNRYLGNYQTPHGAFQGVVEQRGHNYFRFYIFNPPQVLQEHSHWTCFMHRGGNRYEVHMGREPKDVSSGIMTIERLITEAFED